MNGCVCSSFHEYSEIKSETCHLCLTVGRKREWEVRLKERVGRSGVVENTCMYICGGGGENTYVFSFEYSTAD